MHNLICACSCKGAEKSEQERESVPYQPQAIEVHARMRQEDEYLREKLDYRPMEERKVKILTCFNQDHVVEKYDMLKPAEKERLANDCELLEMDITDMVMFFCLMIFRIIIIYWLKKCIRYPRPRDYPRMYIISVVCQKSLWIA